MTFLLQKYKGFYILHGSYTDSPYYNGLFFLSEISGFFGPILIMWTQEYTYHAVNWLKKILFYKQHIGRVLMSSD